MQKHLTPRINGRSQVQFIQYLNVSRYSTNIADAKKVDATRKSRTILSGIQPTGIPHVGNYLGALKAWGKLSKTAAMNDTLIFSIVDLHSLTVPPSPDNLRKWKREAAAVIMASGVDIKKCTLFAQSAVAKHAELCWILMCYANFGYLSRMTQWKSKLDIREQASVADAEALERLQLGIFSYPVLQAADVLLYRATHVPVGEDQVQHLELTRHLARRMNKIHNKALFPIPDVLLTPTPRIKSLKDPKKKMSKSDKSNASRIMLSDTPDIITNKIKKAPTDSISGVTYDPENRPGISNLIDIVAGMLDQTPLETAKLFKKIDTHFEFKKQVTDIIVSQIEPIRLEFEKLLSDPAYIDEVLANGAIKADKIASPVLKDVKTAVGIL
ncbi:hypothetical protein V1511DRAFT_504186 [Dipodascopsis uninucleata]